MSTQTTHFSWVKPGVNNPTDQDIWGNELNNNLDAQDTLIYNISSTGSGTSRPSYAVNGTLWVDNTANPWVLNLYDGTEDVPLGQINTSTHQFTPVNGVMLTNKGDLLTSDGTANATLPVGINGQFLTANSVATNGIEWVYAPTVIQKTIDQSIISNTTLADDNTLFFTMEANESYTIELLAFYSSPSAQVIKFTFNGTSTPVKVLGNVNITGSGSSALTNNFFTAYTTTYTATSQTNGLIKAWILVQNGTNSGTFSFQWAQNASSTTPLTVLGGSYIRYT